MNLRLYKAPLHRKFLTMLNALAYFTDIVKNSFKKFYKIEPRSWEEKKFCWNFHLFQIYTNSLSSISMRGSVL
jgi:hypothetical protein